MALNQLNHSLDDLVRDVKAAGQEVIDRAEDLVGKGGMLSDLDIHINFSCGYQPTITSEKTYLIPPTEDDE